MGDNISQMLSNLDMSSLQLGEHFPDSNTNTEKDTLTYSSLTVWVCWVESPRVSDPRQWEIIELENLNLLL